MELENNTLEIYVDNVIEHYTVEDAIVLNSFVSGALSREEFLINVERYMKKLKVPNNLQKEVMERFKNFLWAYDKLEPLIKDSEVRDIYCYSYDHIRVKRIRNNQVIAEDSPIKFSSPEHYRRFIHRLAIKNKIDLSEQRAMPRFVDKLSNSDWRLRCNIITSFLTSDEKFFLYIRKEPKIKYSLKELNKKGMFSEKVMPYLVKAAQGPIIVSGATGSGKTDFMNALIEEISYENHVMIIQADDELFADKHPGVLAVHTVEAADPESISYSFYDISRTAMQLGVQHLILSEVKGKEAREVLAATINGINSWLSLHSSDSKSSLYQFANLVKMSMDVDIKDIFRTISFTPFTLIHLSKYKIDEITIVRGWDEDRKEIMFEDVEIS